MSTITEEAMLAMADALKHGHDTYCRDADAVMRKATDMLLTLAAERAQQTGVVTDAKAYPLWRAIRGDMLLHGHKEVGLTNVINALEAVAGER